MVLFINFMREGTDAGLGFFVMYTDLDKSDMLNLEISPIL